MRHLDLEGAKNVRDLGGYPTVDGGQTRWRRIFRADSLHQLSPDDQALLTDVGVRTVVDLRRTAETETHVNVFADSEEVDYHHLNMLSDEELNISPTAEGTSVPQHMAHHYFGYLDKCQAVVSRILITLAEAGDHAVLFHCAAGKDRTGVIAALILSLSGVPEETIAADYGLSAHYLAGPDCSWKEYQEAHCPPETISFLLRHLEETYGGVEGYMSTIGMLPEQIGRLRDRLIA